MNLVQAALDKLRKARIARADYDRKVREGTDRIARKIEMVLDQVHAEMPLKSRDEQILLTDEEYAEYARKHFALQLSVAGTILLSFKQDELDTEDDPDFRDDAPKDLEF